MDSVELRLMLSMCWKWMAVFVMVQPMFGGPVLRYGRHVSVCRWSARYGRSVSMLMECEVCPYGTTCTDCRVGQSTAMVNIAWFTTLTANTTAKSKTYNKT